MKKFFIIFCFLIIYSLESSAVTISGTIIDENKEAVIGANIRSETTPGIGTTSDINGKFSMDNFPDNEKIVVSYIGYKSQTLNPGQNLNIVLIEDSTALDEVNVDAEWKSRECNEEELKKVNAKSGRTERNPDGNGVYCKPTECSEHYELSEDEKSCVLKEEKANTETTTTNDQEENKDTPTENNTENKEETDNTPKLSEEDSKKKIAELQENYDAMKEKEQSTENKLLGAGAMASIGAGGQMVASALAEQKADEAAELDMTAYLATFRCDFGQGRNIKGGETDIVLPGGNDLAPLYTEYVKLAQDLKIRKEALGMTPGIESEEILDKANMGLYDNESIGKTDGAFTSLAAALSNPTGADAAEWAAQKAETTEQLKTGAITAGAGAVASIAANIAINENKNAKQENSAEIIKRYEALKKLQQDVEKLPDQEKTARCPTGSKGTYPNCTCTQGKQIYNSNANSCDTCPGNKIAVDNKCQCPEGTAPGQNNTCIKTTVTPKCDSKDPNITVNTETGDCTCINGYIKTTNGQNCECPASQGYTIDTNGNCIKKSITANIATAQQVQTAILPAKNLFELNSSNLTQQAKSAITEFVSNVKSGLSNNTAYCINVTGHTDKTGTDAINNPLSQKRADAVKNALVNSGIPTGNIKASGVGSTACEKTGNQPECRKVEIEFTSSACSA